MNISVDWKNSKFIWGTVPAGTTGSSLDLDNDILFWYRKCDAGGTVPSGQGMPLFWTSSYHENTVRVKFQNIKMMLKFLNKVEMKPNKKCKEHCNRIVAVNTNADLVHIVNLADLVDYIFIVITVPLSGDSRTCSMTKPPIIADICTVSDGGNVVEVSAILTATLALLRLLL